MEEPETKHCSNCKRDIAVANFVMHEVHCVRNIVLCRECGEPVPRSEMADHQDEYHALVPCDKCGTGVARPDMDEHQSEACTKRLVQCEYCEMEKTMDSLAEHEQYCGTRTEQCPLCEQYIMIQDQAMHDQTECQYPQTNNTSASTSTRPAAHSPPVQPGLNRLNTFALDELCRISDLPMIRNDTKRMQKNEERWRTEKNRRMERFNHRDLNEGLETDNLADVDDDFRLAMQLSRQHGSDSSSRQHDSPPVRRWLDNDLTNSGLAGREKTRLPCEFCHHLYPSDDLIQHQSGCSGPLGTETALQARARRRSGSDPGARPGSDQGSNASGPPRMRNEQDWISDPFPSEFTTADDIMLPCEFCDDPFPVEFLVQHQAVCDMNRTETPRPPRPRPFEGDSPPPTRPLRRQGDPNVFLNDEEGAPKLPTKAAPLRSGAPALGGPAGAARMGPTGRVPYLPRHRPTDVNPPRNDSSLRNNNNLASRRRSTGESGYQPSFTTSAPRRSPAATQIANNHRTNNASPVAGTSNESGPTIQPRNNLRARQKRKPET